MSFSAFTGPAYIEKCKHILATNTRLTVLGISEEKNKRERHTQRE